jgi:hypothetical protein
VRCCYCGRQIEEGMETVKVKHVCGMEIDMFYCPAHSFRAFIDIGVDGT